LRPGLRCERWDLGEWGKGNGGNGREGERKKKKRRELGARECPGLQDKFPATHVLTSVV